MWRPSEPLRHFFAVRTPGALRLARDAGEEGFTLIELAIVLVILPLVLGAIAIAIIVTLQDEAKVSTRISASVDSQLTSAFYVRDVQSATSVTVTATPSGNVAVCGNGTKLLVALSWPSGGSGTGLTKVSYWQKNDRSGTGSTLVRTECKTGASRAASTTSTDFHSSFPTAVVSCVAKRPKCVTAATAKSAKATWAPAQWISSVTLAAVEPSGKYDFNVTAVPRVSNTKGATVGIPPGGGGFTTLPTLLLLGGATRVISEDSSGTSITVNGTTVLNTGYIHQTKGSSIKTTKIETTDTPVSNICTVPNGQAKCYTVKPTPSQAVHLTAPLPNPLAGLPDPPKATLATGTGCSTSLTLKPGLYTCKIQPHPGTNLKLLPGIYEFETGLSLKNAALTAKTVFIYLPCKTVDTWASSCSEAFTVTNSTINVSAMRTGLYAGMWFWQNAGDASAVTLHAKSAFSATGIMYAPGAPVSLYGGPGLQTTVGSIIANILDVHNGTFVLTGV